MHVEGRSQAGLRAAGVRERVLCCVVLCSGLFCSVVLRRCGCAFFCAYQGVLVFCALRVLILCLFVCGRGICAGNFKQGVRVRVRQQTRWVSQ